MDKYRKIPREKEPIGSDEIRITSGGKVPGYVTYASRLFNELEKKRLTIKATGNAIARAVTLAEIVKRRFKGLHQITKIGSTTITDTYEPLEEGLDNVSHERIVSCIEIILSKEPIDDKCPGYQPPLDESLVKEMTAEEIARSRPAYSGMFRGRGYRGRGEFRGRGSYRGRGIGEYRGGRGGYRGRPSYSMPSRGGYRGRRGYLSRGGYRGGPFRGRGGRDMQ